MRAFAHFVWGRFEHDDCFSAAGTLSYTTVFALVPLVAVVLGVFASFPMFSGWTERITDFVFANFVPSAARVVKGYLTQFASNAYQLTIFGFIALVISALLLMAGIEDSFNRIFRASKQRAWVSRFIVYWSVLTLGPILVAASLAVTSNVFTLSVIGEADRTWHFSERLFRALPFALTWVCLWLAYIVIPATSVRMRYAAVGATLGTLLFELAKRGFAEYLARTNYELIFGALAVVPIFLLWIYLLWLIVLLGASIAAAAGAFRFDANNAGLAPKLQLLGALRLLRLIRAAADKGTPLTRAALALGERSLTDTQVDRLLEALLGLKLVIEADGALLTLRDLHQVAIAELVEDAGLGLPMPADFELLAGPPRADEQQLIAGLKDLAQVQARNLEQPIASWLTSDPPQPIKE